MNKKQIFISICLFIVFFSLLSVASASDTTDNVTVTAVSDDSNTISVTNNQDYNLGASSRSFIELNNTISGSQAGDTIIFSNSWDYSTNDGDFSEGILIDKDMTIDGHGYVINAHSGASIFNIQGNSKVILRDIDFVNAVGVNGSAIKLGSSAKLEIINCNFNDNVAQMCGGAIYVSDSSSLTSNLIISGSNFNRNSARFGGAIYWTEDYGSVINSKFSHNSASQDGGAIYWEGNHGLIKGSTFEYNNVSGVLNSDKNKTRHNDDTGIDEIHYDILGGDGGAIIWKGSDALIEDSNFYKNYAPYRGGAIFFTGMEGENCTNVTINNTNFNENYAAMNGGAIDWASGASNATIISSNFIKNVADRSAGAIYVRGNGLEIKDSVFKNNKLTGNTLYDNRTDGMTFTSIGGNGGAICWMGSYGTVDNVVFSDNIASQRGGAIQFERNVNGTVKNSRFTNNRAGTEGGAIDFYNGAENGKIINSNFTNNVAGENGGAIYWQGHYGTINGSRFDNNKAIGVGDGALISTTTNPNTNQSENRYNISGGDGGAIKWTGSHGIIEDTTFYKNTAYYSGGALYLTGNATENCTNITFVDCEFTQNVAYLNGGAINWAAGSTNATLIGSQFSKNKAKRSAGAIYISGNYLNIKDASFNNNAATKDVTYDNRTGSGTFASLGGNAGAICWMGSYGTVDNSTFYKNTAEDRGGAIQFERNENGTVKNCYFEQNSAKGDGGAIDWYQGAINGQLLNSTFKANTISGFEGNGAGVYIEGFNATIRDSKFYSHSTNSDGAAVYVAGNECQVFDSYFKDNTAGDDGGAIYWEGNDGFIHNITCVNNKGTSVTKPDGVNTSSTRGGTMSIIGNNVTVEKSTFNSSRANMAAGKNSSKVDGGALFITGNYVNIVETSFYDCSAVHAGGAFYIIGNETRIINCSITKTTSGDGGAIYIEGHDAVISDSRSVSSTATDNGGSVHVEGYGAHIYNSSFVDTTALIGGAIYIAGDDVVVDNSTFLNNKGKNKNSTKGSGGAIYIDGERATISNSNFAKDSAINYGGAISVWGANANITKNTFDECTVTKVDGGAIFVKGVNSIISESNFTKCKSTAQFAHGGAIGVEGSKTTVVDCNFTSCESYFGGVVYIAGSDVVIDNSNFKKNIAQEGGAIYVNGTDAVISKSNFSDITAKRYGGSIFVAGNGANISESNFDNCIAQCTNTKDMGGGAIFISGVHTSIDKSNFVSCKVPNNNNLNSQGGAIYVLGEYTVITDSNFDKCSATNGGDIYGFGNYMEIDNSTFKSSTANKGGAIYLDSWGASINHPTIIGCNASVSGGAIYVAGGSAKINSGNFDGCIAKGGSATQGGGAIYIDGSYTNITSSNFTGNKANNNNARGGTIFIKGVWTWIEKSQFNDSAANQGGVIYIEGENAIIDSSAFANSSSKAQGGAISIVGSSAVIERAQFENIRSNSNGGAIFADGKDTQVLYSAFDNCTSRNNGGAIYINNVGTNVWYSNFTKSQSSVAGAIYINGTNTHIHYCNFENNSANSAGAIRVTGKDTILSNNNCTNNVAKKGDGGALDIGGDNASVYYSWFDGNDASSNGGAINWIGGHDDDSIIGCTFTRNNCNNTEKGGGAIYWTAAAELVSGGLIEDSIFINNTASGRHGGAINWFHARDSKINNCLFINNTALCDGGALYTGDQRGGGYNLTITNSQFYNNTANKHGGAIANQMYSSYIYNNTFDGNKAQASGGTLLMKEGPAKNSVIDHCYIFNSYVNQSYVNNTFGEGGGAILIADDNITITNCAIYNSVANSTFGGAIAVRSIDASLINVTIQNAATLDDNGGAIYWSGVGGYMENITIFNSSSNSRGNKDANGGAIYLASSNCNLTNISIISSSSNNPNANSTKSSHGGAIYVSGNSNSISDIIIENSTSTSGNFKSDGGAIYWYGSSGNLTNASISNTIATGEGGAIYWNGGKSVIDDVSIEYSRTNVTNSTKDANGGAIYSTGLTKLTNIHIFDALASTDAGDIRGGAIYFRNGENMTNVTVLGSRASTGNGTSYGGAVYWKNDKEQAYIYDSSFVNNTADFGGAVYMDTTSASVHDTVFEGNVAGNGGAFYGNGRTDDFVNASFVENKARGNGGAIYAQDVNVQIYNSSLTGNRAEQNGGAICHNRTSKSDLSEINGTSLTGNVAYRGSAIYATKLFPLTDTVLLDNQANANRFANKTLGVDNATGKSYTSTIFVGNDNMLNAMWIDEDKSTAKCTNVTYLGVNGVETITGVPDKSNQEVCQNITVELYDDDGNLLSSDTLISDANGMVKYLFDGQPGKTYNFAYIHESDSYYTYLRDTLSNRSIVKINVNDFYYGNATPVYISLNDGAMGGLNGTVTVWFNDTNHTTLKINVTDGIYKVNHTLPFEVGTYNASVLFEGDSEHTGDFNWNLTHVLPVDDVAIFKDVNITAEYVNVSDIVKYTINVTNYGPTRAYGVNVTEIISPYLEPRSIDVTRGYYNQSEGKWYIGELDVGEVLEMTIVAKVIHIGTVSNTVWVNSEGWDKNTSNDISSARNFTALPIIDLAINKYVNTTSDVVNVTDVIRYTVNVTNYGPCNATGVYVQEFLDAHLMLIYNETTLGRYENGTWNIGQLDAGANATLTIIAQIIDSGIIPNEVIVKGFEPDTNMSNNYDAVVNVAEGNVDLQIFKRVNVTGTVNVGDRIEFIVSVYNAGPANARGVYVGEKIEFPLRLISNSTSIGSFDGSTWVIGTLNKGEVHNLTIVAEVIDVGSVSNYVFVTGTDHDTNLTNNYANVTNITAETSADLSVTKEVNVTSTVVDIGDVLKFTITVHNAGPANATGVNVSEVLSPYLQLVSYVQTAGEWNGSVWTIGNVNAGSTETLNITVEVASAGVISNAVVVRGNEKDRNMSNNHDEIDNLTVRSLVDVRVNKTVSATKVKLGDDVVYIITVQNNGPGDATDVNVTGNLSNNGAIVQYSASQGNYDKTNNVWYVGKLASGSIETLTLTVQAVELGIIENSVVVNSTENDTNLTNNRYVCENVTVTSTYTPIDLYAYDITYGDDENLVVTLPTGATGTVNITVADRTYNNVPITNGIAEITVSDLAGGRYPVTVVYGGDEIYVGNSTSGSFNVAPITPVITIEVEDIWVWEVEVLNVTVNAPGTVFVTVNGVTVEIPLENGVVTTGLLAAAKHDYLGNATWNIYNLPAGTYPAFALYPGNENYTSVNISDVFNVRDLIPTTVIADADDIHVGEDAIIDIVVGPQGVTGSVIVEVEGRNYTVPLKDGRATLVVPDLKAGVKDVHVWYEGNMYYLPSENTTTFNVLKIKPPVSIDAPEITVGEDGVIIVTVPDDATGTITIEIEGERYTADIEDGEAVFIIPGLEVGVHDIIAFYSGDDKYLPANNTGEIKVNPKETPDHHNKTHKKSTIEHEMYATGNPIVALIAVMMSICLVQVRRFKK